jgi:hypothetical protein
VLQQPLVHGTAQPGREPAPVPVARRLLPQRNLSFPVPWPETLLRRRASLSEEARPYGDSAQPCAVQTGERLFATGCPACLKRARFWLNDAGSRCDRLLHQRAVRATLGGVYRGGRAPSAPAPWPQGGESLKRSEANAALRERVERGIYKRRTRDGVVRANAFERSKVHLGQAG